MKKFFTVTGITSLVIFVGFVFTNNARALHDEDHGSDISREQRSARATDVKIHPRVLLKGLAKERFEKEKKQEEDLLNKGLPVKTVKPPKDDGTTVSIAATGVVGAEMTESANKYAIVIGICDYPDGLEYGDICTSDGDARNMYRALTTEYGFLPENIYLFRDMTDDVSGEIQSRSASYANIVHAVDQLRAAVPADGEVVFFFSGHGVTGIYNDGDNETKRSNPDEAILVHNGVDQYAYIWDGDLKNWFSGFATERISFIFDSCRAEGMNDVMQGAALNVNGRTFVAATTETGIAQVYSNGIEGEGIFSHYFINNGMRGYDGPGGGWADGYNVIGWDHRTEDGWMNPPVVGQDGYVVVEEAYEYAKEKAAAIQKVVIKDLFVNDLLLGRY